MVTGVAGARGRVMASAGVPVWPVCQYMWRYGKNTLFMQSREHLAGDYTWRDSITEPVPKRMSRFIMGDKRDFRLISFDQPVEHPTNKNIALIGFIIKHVHIKPSK